MTLEQCKRLKEMGFPQGNTNAQIVLSNTAIDEDGNEIKGDFIVDVYGNKLLLELANELNRCYANPTAEEALEWVAGKLNQIITIRILIKHVMISCYVKDGKYHEFISECSLSDAVYALIVWAYENKLLEGK